MVKHLQSADTPVANDVPVWVTDHWEYQPVAVTTANGVGGDGSAADPLVALTSGVWGTAPLDVFGADSLIGHAVYVDTAGQLRTRPDVIPDIVAKVPTDLPVTYPVGTTVMTIPQAQGAPWPSKTTSIVVSHSRHETGVGSASVAQYCFLNSNTVSRVWFRNGTSDAWSPWVELSTWTAELDPPDINLDTVTVRGVYSQSESAEATAALNYPVNEAGLLEVFDNPQGGANMTWQRYSVYAKAAAPGGAVYARGAYSGVWQPWVEVAAPHAFGRAMATVAQAIPKAVTTTLNGLTLEAGATGVTLVSGSQLRAPTDGLYTFSAIATFTYIAGGGRSMFLYKVGVTQPLLRVTGSVATATSPSIVGSVTVSAVAGDLFYLGVYQSSAGSINTDPGFNGCSITLTRL